MGAGAEQGQAAAWFDWAKDGARAQKVGRPEAALPRRPNQRAPARSANGVCRQRPTGQQQSRGKREGDSKGRLALWAVRCRAHRCRLGAAPCGRHEGSSRQRAFRLLQHKEHDCVPRACTASTASTARHARHHRPAARRSQWRLRTLATGGQGARRGRLGVGARPGLRRASQAGRPADRSERCRALARLTQARKVGAEAVVECERAVRLEGLDEAVEHAAVHAGGGTYGQQAGVWGGWVAQDMQRTMAGQYHGCMFCTLGLRGRVRRTGKHVWKSEGSDEGRAGRGVLRASQAAASLRGRRHGSGCTRVAVAC